VVVCLVGAFMSTIDTHLNLGASYMVNDIYRRFLKKDADDKHYVMVSRLIMAVLLSISVVISLNLSSIGEAWKFLLTFASGAGLTWIVRWFWWRANAYTEFAGMITSGVVATYLTLFHDKLLYSDKLFITVGITTVVWLTVTFLTPPVEEKQLLAFVKAIRPGSIGWGKIYQKCGLEPEPFLLKALGLWALGLVFLFGLNFGIGSVLFNRPATAWGLFTVSGIALVILWWVLRRSLGSASASP
jgi:SSS family solute:Na+ symporter